MSERDDRRPEEELPAIAPWRETWRALELPEPGSAPPGFAARVAARARAERSPSLGLPWSPVWARLAAAAAVALGIAGGAGLGLLAAPGDELVASIDSSGSLQSLAATAADSWTASSLAEDLVSGAAQADDSTTTETP